ncbi:MAG TPA: glycosyltransferase [Acidimicrobiia bacterium]|nr:glycosyltransferase [Acidimicrobiia bacterium]
MTFPEPPFEHLLRLSDDTGVLEHARGAVPRRQSGYCTDDTARALVVISRQPSPSAELTALGERCLAFLVHAQAGDGACHNRLGYDRRWVDQPGLGDWWGRSLWASGTAAARGRSARFRADALAHFEAGAVCRSPWPRPMAFAALGAAEVLTVRPDHAGARDLLKAAGAALSGVRDDEQWPWPEPRLAYANARWAESLLVVGWALEDDRLVEDGLRQLEWLLDVETVGDHLSLTPVGGWAPGEPRPGFDQQPIEAAALADACARAYLVTGGEHFLAGVTRAVGWFLGANDTQVPMYDARSGGGYDGLERDGRNDNQGAESTIALISTLQQGIRLIGNPS